MEKEEEILTMGGRGGGETDEGRREAHGSAHGDATVLMSIIFILF